MLRLSQTLFLLGCCGVLFAQEGRLPALDFIRDHPASFGVSAADVRQLRESDRYRSPDGTEHVYVAQLLYGTPVYNAQAAVHLRGEEVVYHTSRLQPDLLSRSTPGVPALTAAAAFSGRAYGGPAVLEEDRLVYFPVSSTGPLRLAWQLTVATAHDGLHLLSMVDAVTGSELYRDTLTVSCTLPSGRRGAGVIKTPGAGKSLSEDGAAYRVYRFGLDSPLDGPRTLERDPSDPLASPFSWHDTDGSEGAEYTITRGNNVYAYRDADANGNQPDSGYVADGGASLLFDFPHGPDRPTVENVPAALTQLFYTTNMLHDWAWHHGFTPEAGNFQDNLYGAQGRGGDAIEAEIHNATTPNNATFFTPADGRPGRLQMSLWQDERKLVTIASPASLAGTLPGGTAVFGASLDTARVTAPLALGADASARPPLGCGPLTDPANLKGKIVLLTRGECTFQQKAYRAEQAGAVGVIICNPGNDLITMAAGDAVSHPVTIPVVMLRERDCQPLRAALVAGTSVTATLADVGAPPLDGAFDNGVVAHEYGHGISGRLVGGPAANTCLLNDEQMGEGWSDFFLLATTPLTPGAHPDGTERRSIGPYSSGGTGFRTYPYATDPAINPLGYDDIITATVPHGVGEAWAATLWDVYWALVEAYGFDPDLVHGDGGNNRAVRLVIEAMKYTPCSPGYLDARDGLLTADQLAHDGADACLLWDVFRRRGLGASATQGSAAAHNDNRAAYDLSPTCIPTLKLAKTAERLYTAAGDSVVVHLEVRNDRDLPALRLSVREGLTAGLLPDLSTVTGADSVVVAGDTLTFFVDSLGAGGQRTITYRARTAPDRFSARSFFAGAEQSPDALTPASLEGRSGWIRRDSNAFAGSSSWFVPDPASAQEQVLQTSTPILIEGSAPVLRFFTSYRTEPAYDAGVVELSTDGSTWQATDSLFWRFGYRGHIDPRGRESLRGRGSFWGDSEGYREVIMDLSGYRGREVYVRWRFASDREIGGEGWWLDNVEIMPEPVTYNTTARLRLAGRDVDTARFAGPGIVIDGEGSLTVATYGPAPAFSFGLYPNPAVDRVSLSFGRALSKGGSVSVIAPDGRTLRSRSLPAGASAFDLPLQGLPPAVYRLRVDLPDRGTVTSPLVIH